MTAAAIEYGPKDSASSLDSPARRRRYRTVVLAIVAVGVICRLVQFLHNPSLWHDEALVTLNVMHRSYGQLARPLDYEQAAPPAFLWAERALLRTFGFSEYTLRAVSLVCGIGTLVLAARLGWRLLPPPVAACVTTLFALCDKLIWHSAEVKQYSCDAFAALLLFSVAVGLGRPASAAARFGLLCCVAAAMVWCSFPAVFVFAALSITFLPQVMRERRTGVVLYLLGNFLVCGSFAALYWLSVRGHAGYLDEYWAEHFVPWSRPWAAPVWLVREIYHLCDHPYRSFGWLVLPVAVLGAVHLVRTGRARLLWAFAGPMFFCLLAAALHKYPFTGDRITIFLVPGLLLLFGFGIEWFAETHWRWWAVVPLPMVVAGTCLAGYHLVVPHSRSAIRPVVQYLRAHRQPGDAIYLVGEGGTPDKPSVNGRNLELLCYWPDADRDGPVHRTLPDVRAMPERRFWIVFAALPEHGTRLMDPLLREARKTGAQIDQKVVRGGGAFLFDRSRPAYDVGS